MTVACPACGTRLRVRTELIEAGRSTARCPRCSASVPLSVDPAPRAPMAASAPSATLLVSCSGCGAKLRAPAAAGGGRSHCPRCGGVVAIPGPVSIAASARAATPPGPDDAASAATLRMDHRALSMLGRPVPDGADRGVDLATYLRSATSAPPPDAHAGVPDPSAPGADSPPTGGSSLLRPPVEQMKVIAREIRGHTEAIGAPGKPATRPLEPPPRAAPAPAPPAAGIAPPERKGAGEPHPSRPAPAHAPAHGRVAPRPYPVSRGTILGAVAGGVVAGALVAAEPLAALPAGPWIFTPAPALLAELGLLPSGARAALLVLLGAMSGFITAATGGAARGTSPMTLLRCLSYATLAGLAAGLTAALMQGGGEAATLVAAWTKDLVATGGVTWLLDRLAGRRTR